MNLNIFKTFTFKWWQAAIFKWSLISLGIILGVYFQAFFLQWIAVVAVVFAVTVIYITGVWLKQ